MLKYHAIVLANSDKVSKNLKRRFKSLFAPLKLRDSMMVSWKRINSQNKVLLGVYAEVWFLVTEMTYVFR